MKNVLLIGDSIRMGYDKAVRDALEGRANVIFPEDNCRFASYVFRYMQDWFDGIDGKDIDVIHWNAGLHDCLRTFGDEPDTPIEIYEYYIGRICEKMKKLCPKAKVIFATCTRVIPERMNKNYIRTNQDVLRYNSAAERIVKSHGFRINDLHALSMTMPDEYLSDAVHYYTPMAQTLFAKQVLKEIEDVL